MKRVLENLGRITFAAVLGGFSFVLPHSAQAQMTCETGLETEACTSCINRLADAPRGTIELLCNGGASLPDSLFRVPLNCNISVETCPEDLEVYRICMEGADTFRRSGELEAINARYEAIKRAPEAVSCAADGLPALLYELDRLIEIYSAFNARQTPIFDQCLSEQQALAHDNIRLLANDEPGQEISLRGLAVAVDRALLVDQLKGFAATNQIFRTEGEIRTIRDYVAGDLEFCS